MGLALLVALFVGAVLGSGAALLALGDDCTPPLTPTTVEPPP